MPTAVRDAHRRSSFRGRSTQSAASLTAAGAAELTPAARAARIAPELTPAEKAAALSKLGAPAPAGAPLDASRLDAARARLRAAVTPPELPATPVAVPPGAFDAAQARLRARRKR